MARGVKMKYEVTIREIEIYTVPVEADSIAEAKDKAWDLLTDNNENKAKYHNDSDGESEAIELD